MIEEFHTWLYSARQDAFSVASILAFFTDDGTWMCCFRALLEVAAAQTEQHVLSRRQVLALLEVSLETAA